MMEISELIHSITSLPDDELVQLKKEIITKIDKHRYAKEVLSNMDKEDAGKTIDWIKREYKIT